MWSDRARDEARHPLSPVEAWWWWGGVLDAAGEPTLAWFVGLELRGRRFDYWAGLARTGQPYLYVEELDGTGLRDGLEVKPPEMWAGHDCDLPFRQWSLGNEAHGVLVDDPAAVLRRPFGDVEPVAFDIEWYSSVEPRELDMLPGSAGYRQVGEFDARIELAEGVLQCTGPSSRVHVWGSPYRPPVEPAQQVDGRALGAHLRRSDGTVVLQWLTRTGWAERSAPSGDGALS